MTSFKRLTPTLYARYYSELKQAMEKNGIIKDVIDTPPDHETFITYPSGAAVHLGNVLTPRQVKDIPAMRWISKPKYYYTLALVDPDAPSRKDHKLREWLHWLVVNIPNNNVKAGETIADYIGSAPPEDTGLHRYTFLIYEHANQYSCKLTKLGNNSTKGRSGFNVRRYAQRYDLGVPISGNFYQAQYDDYVPEVYRQLGER